MIDLYIYNANLNATVGPADLFVPLRNKSSSLLYNTSLEEPH